MPVFVLVVEWVSTRACHLRVCNETLADIQSFTDFHSTRGDNRILRNAVTAKQNRCCLSALPMLHCLASAATVKANNSCTTSARCTVILHAEWLRN